jgi:hypothetical protein
VPCLVNAQPAAAEGHWTGSRTVLPGAVQHGLYPQDEFGWAERLGDVVVSTVPEALDPVLHAAARG